MFGVSIYVNPHFMILLINIFNSNCQILFPSLMVVGHPHLETRYSGVAIVAVKVV